MFPTLAAQGLSLLSGNCQEGALHDRGAPYMVPTVVTSYPDVLVLCPVVSCMTLVLTVTLVQTTGQHVEEKIQNMSPIFFHLNDG
jgi:hypothetical protein